MKGNYAGGDLELSKKLASLKKYLILIALNFWRCSKYYAVRNPFVHAAHSLNHFTSFVEGNHICKMSFRCVFCVLWASLSPAASLSFFSVKTHRGLRKNHRLLFISLYVIVKTGV